MRLLALLLYIHTNLVYSANILGVTTLLSHSHHIWNEVIAEALLAKGHNVTYLSHDPARIKHENYTVIEIKGVYEAIHSHLTLEESPNTIKAFSAAEYWGWIELICSLDLKSDELKLFLNSYPKDYKFDLILWDVNAGFCLYPLIKRFGNPPVVGVSPFGIQAYISEMFGDHFYNYIPYYAYSLTDRMSLWEKIQNTFTINYYNLKRRHTLDRMKTSAIEYFGNDVEDFQHIERNFSIALVNSDAITSFPQALAPNIIPVGGLHVKKPKPIQQDIQRIIDESKDGVIYFALGSNLKSEKVNKNVLDSFVKCYETLPQTILWKMDGSKMKLPKNVKAFPWYAQNDILAHPKTVLFISHGGALSTQESMQHGVPIVGLPFYLDQISNIERLVARQVAERIDFSEITTDYVCSKIKQVLLDAKYRENMQVISRRVKDQQNSPLERAVFWIEYVLRHKGAEHLSLAARDMTIFKSLNLDLLTLALLLLTAIILVLAKSFQFVSKCFNDKTINKLKVN